MAAAAISRALWGVVFLYHAALLWVLVRDARALPSAEDFTASRELPEPLSLGAEQEVLLGVSCARAGVWCSPT